MVRVRTETIRYSEERATAEKAASYHVKYDKLFHKRISNSSEHALLRTLLERVGDVDSIIDIPCGTGRVSKLFAERAKRVYEFDYSREMVSRLRSSRSFYEPRVGVATAFHLPFRDRSADLSVSIRLSHHIPDFEGRCWHLRELLRVSDRFALITFFDAASVKNRLRELRRGLGSRKRAKFTLTRGTVAEIAASSGFEPVEFRQLSRCFSGHTFALLRRQM